MPLAKDGKTGWPTPEDPDPGGRRPLDTRQLTGWPTAKEAKPRPSKEPQLNAELDRKLKTAAATQARTRRARVAKAIIEAYEVEPLTKVPGPRGEGERLFSRTCKLAKCSRHFFTDEQSYYDHVFQAHGSAEKDEKFRALTAEPTEEEES